ncbi:chromosome-anchoring protein RacA [Oxobacter pfennigii]|uniref:Chromosome-anchoring protein RacA n=1 Tax=Oxobacter pfennigii TaxID=36849 RepID=A0A0P8YTJ3_9CLOT|nr:helix-turn-helix domain-containing protein [Oxobacter pfennigii]KPU43018.1 chromosome-anchoring protein RacA [Oxobacter pfennigii]
MDKLLTKKDLAERWQVSTKTIENWVKEGKLTPCRNIPGDMRFHPDYITELEGVKLDKFSPLERRKMEREIEELKVRLEKAEGALAKVSMISTEAVYFKLKEA